MNVTVTEGSVGVFRCRICGEELTWNVVNSNGDNVSNWTGRGIEIETKANFTEGTYYSTLLVPGRSDTDGSKVYCTNQEESSIPAYLHVTIIEFATGMCAQPFVLSFELYTAD